MFHYTLSISSSECRTLHQITRSLSRVVKGRGMRMDALLEMETTVASAGLVDTADRLRRHSNQESEVRRSHAARAFERSSSVACKHERRPPDNFLFTLLQVFRI
jgi:hypothetical protein